MHENDVAYLLNLVRFGLRTPGLQIQDFLDIFTRKDMMVAANSLLKSQVTQQSTQFGKRDVGVGCTPQDLCQQFGLLVHDLTAHGLPLKYDSAFTGHRAKWPPLFDSIIITRRSAFRTKPPPIILLLSDLPLQRRRRDSCHLSYHFHLH